MRVGNKLDPPRPPREYEVAHLFNRGNNVLEHGGTDMLWSLLRIFRIRRLLSIDQMRQRPRILNTILLFFSPHGLPESHRLP